MIYLKKYMPSDEKEKHILSWNKVFDEGDDDRKVGLLQRTLCEIKEMCKGYHGDTSLEFFDLVKKPKQFPYMIWDNFSRERFEIHRLCQDSQEKRSQAWLCETLSDFIELKQTLAMQGKTREDLPLFLRADQIVDEHQIWECKIFGFASFVLSPSFQEHAELQYLIEVGREVGMEPLLRCKTVVELKQALKTDGRFLQLDFENSPELREFYLSFKQIRELVAQAAKLNMVFCCQIHESNLCRSDPFLREAFNHFCVSLIV